MNASLASSKGRARVAGMSKASPLRVGAHTSIAGGLHRALDRGAEVGCDVVQIFCRSNQQWAMRDLRDDELAAWFDARARTGVDPALIHGSYLVNLAGTDPALRERSFQAVAHEYAVCAQLGVPYLNIHPGSHGGDGEAVGIARIAAALDRLWDAQPDNPTMLLLENTAGQGSCVGHRFEHLRDIFAAVRDPSRLGLCVDTCHTLAAGYDIRTPSGWADTFAALEAAVGRGRVKAFHVNDSKTAPASQVDRHEHLGRGSLGLTALRCLVNDARFVGLPMIIETPKPVAAADVLNLGILRGLHGLKRVSPRIRAMSEAPIPGAPARANVRRAPG
jgi:deoxyribonuclease IV